MVIRLHGFWRQKGVSKCVLIARNSIPFVMQRLHFCIVIILHPPWVAYRYWFRTLFILYFHIHDMQLIELTITLPTWNYYLFPKKSLWLIWWSFCFHFIFQKSSQRNNMNTDSSIKWNFKHFELILKLWLATFWSLFVLVCIIVISIIIIIIIYQ